MTSSAPARWTIAAGPTGHDAVQGREGGAHASAVDHAASIDSVQATCVCQNVALRRLGSVAPNAPLALAAVIDRALVFDKAMRWPTARAMRTALEDAYVSSYGEALSGRRPAVLLLSRTVADSPWLPPSDPPPPPTPPATLPMGDPRTTAPTAQPAVRAPTTTRGIESRGSRTSGAGPSRSARVAGGAVAATLAAPRILTPSIWFFRA